MKLKLSIYLALITFLLILPFNAYPENSKAKNIFEVKDGQIIVSSISFDLDMKKSVFTFTGDVDVSREGMSMKCQKLELFFKGSLKDLSAEDSKPSVEKIVATESVVITITSPKKGNATADKAVYYPDSEEILLTGNPYIKYGDRFENDNAEEIRLYLKEERFTAKGTKDKKPSAKIKIESGEDER